MQPLLDYRTKIIIKKFFFSDLFPKIFKFSECDNDK